MMQTIALLVTLGLASLTAAQESSLQLPSCESRCYKQTAEMKGCGEKDYACTCHGFKDEFYPQYSSCLIEGCAFNSAGISQEELESMVCSLAGQSPSPSSSSSSPTPKPSSDGSSVPEPSSSKPTAASTSPGVDGSPSSSTSVSTSVVSNPVPVPPGGDPSIPDETGSPAPTPVDNSDARRAADPAWYGVFWVCLMAVAAAALV